MSAALVWAVPCQAGPRCAGDSPRSRALTSGFRLHTHPKPLQSGTGDTTTLGSGGQRLGTEEGEGGVEEGHGEPFLKQGGASWQNLFLPAWLARAGPCSLLAGLWSCSRSDVSIWLSPALSFCLPQTRREARSREYCMQRKRNILTDIPPRDSRTKICTVEWNPQSTSIKNISFCSLKNLMTRTKQIL